MAIFSRRSLPDMAAGSSIVFTATRVPFHMAAGSNRYSSTSSKGRRMEHTSGEQVTMGTTIADSTIQQSCRHKQTLLQSSALPGMHHFSDDTRQ
jgi:hypothetical protein